LILSRTAITIASAAFAAAGVLVQLDAQWRAGSGMCIGLGRDDILVLLRELNDELRRRGVHADLLLVGGAAIAVAYEGDSLTVGTKVQCLLAEIVDALDGEHLPPTPENLDGPLGGH
jgi:hypothetical protein